MNLIFIGRKKGVLVNKDEILLQVLQEGYRKNYKSRIDNVIHVSNLLEFCPREYALSNKHKVSYNKGGSKLALSQLITYEIGNQMHSSVRRVLRQEGYLVDLPAMHHKDYNHIPVIGHPDAYVKLVRDKKISIVEIKTMGKDTYDTMVEPEVRDVCQLSLYLWLVENCRMSDGVNETLVSSTKGILLYFCKMHRPVPLKTFLVQRNDAFLKSVTAQLKEVKAYSLKGTMPQRICNARIAQMARKCTMTEECFESEKK